MTTLRLDRTEGAAVLTLDRAPVNAMNLALLGELAEAMAALAADPPPRGLVLTGANGVFSAGADLKETPTGDMESHIAARRDKADAAFGALFRLPVPTIAALPGHALGGGLVVTLACDRRLAAPGDYQLGLPEVNVGIAYPDEAWGIVDATLDPSVKRRLVLSGERIDPHTAHDLGIVDALVPAGDLLEHALALGHDLSQAAGYAVVKGQLRGR